MADFSTKLRNIVEEKGITQAWLADKVGTTEATISRYMTGIHKPNLELVARIAQVLDVSIDYIMDLSLSPIPSEKPEQEILILANAYREADKEHKQILWTALRTYLTPKDKEYIDSLLEE